MNNASLQAQHKDLMTDQPSRYSDYPMKRDLQSMAGRNYDVVVIGGGIYGAALAREAALCGLSTALVEKQDFCSATSANSLKIIHGGLRYLQQLDIPRLRTSVLERRAFLRTAPHLVHPLPCIMPTQGHAMKGREAMFLGLLLNEILSLDRNTLADPEKAIPRGSLISSEDVCRLVPGLSPVGITGGCSWNDAYTYNSERLVTALVRDAVDSGADAANYLKCTGFQITGGRIIAVKTRDELTGNTFDISTRLVINAAGPWANEILAAIPSVKVPAVNTLAMGMNFVLKRQLLPKSAAGLRFRRHTGESQRLLFLMPWRGQTLAGTYYRLHQGAADSMKVTEQDIDILLSDLTHAYPSADITQNDIACVLPGLLPARHAQLVNEEPVLANHFSIIDHARRDATEGLVTVVGVKYTTARDVAERTLRQVMSKLGRKAVISGSDRRALPGGHIPDFLAGLQRAKADSRCPAAVMEHLFFNYGDETSAVLALGKENPSRLVQVDTTTPVIGAEVVHAVRSEMALTLGDVVFRRTDLGSAGRPSPGALATCAQIMASECGWDSSRCESEIARVLSSPIYGVT